MNIIEKYDKQFAYTSVVINLIMAYQFYTLLTNPSLQDANKIYTIAVLMAFEFIMVHSGVIMAIVPKRISLYILFPFYGLFALVINYSVEENTILYLYLIVVFNRMRFAFADVPKYVKNRVLVTSIFTAMSWMFLIFITTFNADKISTFGITEDYLLLSGYSDIKKSGGISDQPHVALFFAIIYYISLALIEFFMIRTFSFKKIQLGFNTNFKKN